MTTPKQTIEAARNIWLRPAWLTRRPLDRRRSSSHSKTSSLTRKITARFARWTASKRSGIPTGTRCPTWVIIPSTRKVISPWGRWIPISISARRCGSITAQRARRNPAAPTSARILPLLRCLNYLESAKGPHSLWHHFIAEKFKNTRFYWPIAAVNNLRTRVNMLSSSPFATLSKNSPAAGAVNVRTLL